jgi:transposase InsO family protein
MSKPIIVSNEEEKIEIETFLKFSRYPDGASKDRKKCIRRKCKNLILVNNHLCYKKQDGTILKMIFAFENDLISLILDQEHSDSHPGISKMTDLINRKYYGIPSSTIRSFVNSCENCRSYLPMRTIEDITIVDITKKYDRYVIDCVDLRRYSDVNDGYCWILNIIDSYSKYLWSYKLKFKTAAIVSDALRECFFTFGVPVSIQADNGKEFKNRTLHEMCTNLQIQMIHGRPRNPKAQGIVERVNQTIKRWLAKVLHRSIDKTWIHHLHKVVYKYNTTVHRATNQSPFKLFFGQNGFNASVIIPELAEDEEITPTVFDAEDLIVERGNSVWDLNILQHEIDLEHIYSVQETIYDEHDMTQINDDVLNHFDSYRERIIANANSNLQIRSFNIGDQVMLKKDFDNNMLTKKNAFDSFYEEEKFEIVEVLQNNMIKIKNSVTNLTMIVFKSRIKKIN